MTATYRSFCAPPRSMVSSGADSLVAADWQYCRASAGGVSVRLGTPSTHADAGVSGAA